jgi:hypothetical protein
MVKISLYSDQEGTDGDVKYVGNTSPRYSYGINLGQSIKDLTLAYSSRELVQRALSERVIIPFPWTDWWRQPPAFYYGKNLE